MQLLISPKNAHLIDQAQNLTMFPNEVEISLQLKVADSYVDI